MLSGEFLVAEGWAAWRFLRWFGCHFHQAEGMLNWNCSSELRPHGLFCWKVKKTNTDCFPQGRDFVLEEKMRKQPGPTRGKKWKPEIRAKVSKFVKEIGWSSDCVQNPCLFWNPRNYCHIICSEELYSQKILTTCIPLPKVQSVPFWNPKKYLDLWCLGVLELYVSEGFPGNVVLECLSDTVLAQVLGWVWVQEHLRWVWDIPALPGCPLGHWSIRVWVNPARNLNSIPVGHRLVTWSDVRSLMVSHNWSHRVPEVHLGFLTKFPFPLQTYG